MMCLSILKNRIMRCALAPGQAETLSIGDLSRYGVDIKVPVDMEIVIDGDNGAIGIQNGAGDIDIDVNNAAVGLARVSGNIKINNDNGAIRLASTSIGNVLLDADNGVINVSLGKLAGDSYNIKTDNGMVYSLISRPCS